MHGTAGLALSSCAGRTDTLSRVRTRQATWIW